MNSPFMGKFEVTQEYKGNLHDGLDLVGIDSQNIHSTVNGCCVFSGWENPDDAKQGFGQYIVIREEITGNLFHFAHLSVRDVKEGDMVHITDKIGVMGTTGHSTGPHLHYCVRTTMSPGTSLNISEISGIPNKLGIYDDGYRPNGFKTIELPNELEINGIKYVKK